MAKLGQIATNIGLGAALVYLAANAVTGHQGLAAYVALQDQERALLQEKAQLESEREALSARAARLGADNLDLDYLDERARVLIAAQDSEEIVFQTAPR
ncbi:MAG: septum formation initiator [Alphaproteobacteria bacterium]|nr:septum formation initiator [Alphaproteobacteria bacterium]